MNEPFLVTWRPALIYTSFAIVLLTGLLLITRPLLKSQQVSQSVQIESMAMTWDDDFDRRYSELGAALTAAVYGNDSTDTSDVDAMADELMKMEGSTI
jgi:hypothetical protein